MQFFMVHCWNTYVYSALLSGHCFQFKFVVVYLFIYFIRKILNVSWVALNGRVDLPNGRQENSERIELICVVKKLEVLNTVKE